MFPSVISAGFWVGGQYGEGALRVVGQTAGYYSSAAGSFGLQIGAQFKALISLFMTQDALDRFRNSEGWAAGVDATVAVLEVGANGDIDTSTAASAAQAFVLTNAGLMAGVSLEGTKVTRLHICAVRLGGYRCNRLQTNLLRDRVPPGELTAFPTNPVFRHVPCYWHVNCPPQ
ncbi:YSC84-related protein [Paraburkholderia sp. CNPSo 3272]|nr:YSC84-related protein [Paraburkholderia sp. CNPSo 3272]